MGRIINGLVIISGAIAGWFVAHDQLHFAIVQMVIAILIFTGIVALAAFWSNIKSWFKHKE